MGANRGCHDVQRPSLVLVLDGHDASGKTTLADRLATVLNACHLRPFAGAAGRQFTSAVDQEDFDEAARIAHNAVQDSLAAATSSIAIFDRHWMTVFSILPEAYWHSWKPLPPTTLCWADLPATLERLKHRPQLDSDDFDHPHYLSVYWKLATTFACNIVRTDKLDLEESLATVLAWSRRFDNRT